MSESRSRMWTGLFALFVLICASVTTVEAVSITATATGSLTPGTATYPDTVTNGDFTITGNEQATLVGNGVDETTTWTFDFTTDPDYPLFSTSEPLASALLTMTLTPKNVLITTDLVRIDGLTNITTPIQVLPVGITSTIEIQLLDFYSSGSILGVFSPAGQVPMVYGDDAIISYAQLDLVSVPEPSTLWMLGMGLTGLFALRRRK